ncbi:MAG TPA: DUF2092 domain-containing protein [Polyangia bacterium]|nr:DUF2092 domain-containing protein [Polyangia bacterium]
MISRVGLVMIFVGGVAAAAEPEQTQAPPAGTAREGVIDPKADAALKRMSDYVGGLKSFRVDATTIDEKITTDGQKIQEVQDSQLAVRRPGALRVDRVGPFGRVVFRDDGKRFSVYNKDRHVYATAPAPGDLDAAIDDARDRLHVDAPGGDLIVSDPYHALVDGTATGRYIGLEPIDGAPAHHLAFTKQNVDWQIWIKDGPDAVPLRYVITSKDLPGHPQFTLELRRWQPNAQVAADAFAFTPPDGARRVEFSERGKADVRQEEQP